MRSARYIVIPVLALIVCALACRPASAQVPGLAPASPSAKPSLYETAPIVIDGTPVLRVSALANPPAGAIPLETRVFLINGAIAQVLTIEPDSDATVYDPKTFEIKISQDNGQYVLGAVDARHRVAIPLLTVTTDDALHANLPASDLAAQWQAALRQAIVLALERRQPEQIHRNTTLIIYGAILLVLLTIGAFVVGRMRSGTLFAANTMLVVTLLWIVAITYALTLFSQTVSAGFAILGVLRRLAVIWIAAFLIERLVGATIYQLVRSWASFGVPRDQQPRSLLRVPTMSKALIGFERVFIYFIAVLLSLSALDIPIASVVTIGGIAALAIGFAAQSLVRDFLNGLLVLSEDQYVEGDFIAIGEYNGLVEHLTMRIVQLRDSTGSLITIPHSSVTQVANSSRNWSRVDYRVTVSPSADLRKAFEVLRSTVEGLKADAAWEDAIIDPVEWIGVETLSAGGTTLRLVVRTAPLRQFELRREINLRVAEAFKTAGISLGSDSAPAVVMQPAASPDAT